MSKKASEPTELFQELLTLLRDEFKIISNHYANISGAINAMCEAPDSVETQEEAKEEKKSEKKTPGKTSTARKVFTKADPATTPEEIKLWKAQWKALKNQGLQEKYLNGEIDSEGNDIEGAASVESDSEDFDLDGEMTTQGDDDFNFDGEEAPVVTFEELNELAKKVAKAKGKDTVMKLIAKEKVNGLSSLPEEKYADFKAKLEKALK